MELRALCFITLSVLIGLSYVEGEFNPVPFGIPPPPVNPFASQVQSVAPASLPSSNTDNMDNMDVLMDSYSNPEDVDYDEPTPAFLQQQQQRQQQQQQQQQQQSLSEESSHASSILTSAAQTDLARRMEQIVNQNTQKENGYGNANDNNLPPSNMPPVNQRRAPSLDQSYETSGYEVVPLNLPPPPVFQLPNANIPTSLPPPPSAPVFIQQQQQQQPSDDEYRALAAEERFRQVRKRHNHAHAHTTHTQKTHTNTFRHKRHHQDPAPSFRFRELDSNDDPEDEYRFSSDDENGPDIEPDSPPFTDGEVGDQDGDHYDELAPSSVSDDAPYGYFSTEDPDHPFKNSGEHLLLPSHDARLSEIMQLATYTRQQLKLKQQEELLAQQQQPHFSQDPQQQQPLQRQPQRRMVTPVIDEKPSSPSSRSTLTLEPTLEPLPRPPVVVP